MIYQATIQPKWCFSNSSFESCWQQNPNYKQKISMLLANTFNLRLGPFLMPRVCGVWFYWDNFCTSNKCRLYNTLYWDGISVKLFWIQCRLIDCKGIQFILINFCVSKGLFKCKNFWTLVFCTHNQNYSKCNMIYHYAIPQWAVVNPIHSGDFLTVIRRFLELQFQDDFVAFDYLLHLEELLNILFICMNFRTLCSIFEF